MDTEDGAVVELVALAPVRLATLSLSGDDRAIYVVHSRTSSDIWVARLRDPEDP